MPHGGPHSCNSNTFLSSVIFFIRLGYSVMFANYRGSLGVGTDGIDALPGHCGLTDVDDVYQATKSCLSRQVKLTFYLKNCVIINYLYLLT